MGKMNVITNKLKIYVVGLGKVNMESGWPHHNFDVVAAMEEYKKKLKKIEESSEIDFCNYKIQEKESDIIQFFKEIEKEKFDGVLAINLTSEFASIGPSIFKIADAGLPTVVYTKPFSTYWDGSGKLYAGEYKVEVCESENIEDIVPIFDVVKAIAKLKDTRLLLLKDYDYDVNLFDPRMAEPRWLGLSYFKRLKDIFGIETVLSNSSDIFKYYNQIEDITAKNLSNSIISASKGLLEPTKENITKAARLYLALKNMMSDNNTNAITTDCLNWIRHGSKKLPIAPCLALSKFNDEGIPAGCEADVESLITLSFFHYLAERPGFQADPVIDESKNRITFAHCTAAKKLLGYEQKPFPFWIRTHTESWKNVAVETEMMQKGEVTILKLMGAMSSKSSCWPMINVYNKFEGYSLLAYKAKIIEVNEINNVKKRKEEWGCRTKISVELPKEEIVNFKENFYGFHRIVLYGDYIKELKMLAKFLGIKFVNKLYLKLSDMNGD